MTASWIPKSTILKDSESIGSNYSGRRKRLGDWGTRRAALLGVQLPIVGDELDLPRLGDLVLAVFVDVGDERRRLLQEIVRVELEDLREPHGLSARLELHIAVLVEEVLRAR